MKRLFEKLIGKEIQGRVQRFFSRYHSLEPFFFLVIVIMLLVTTISLIEKSANEPFNSVLDIIYWAIVTISTVGYGDITVHSMISKILAVFLIMCGVLLMSFTTATFASIFTATRIKEGMGLKKIELENHVVVCGFNDNIEKVILGIITTSTRKNPDIVLVNAQQESENTDLIERFPAAKIQFVNGDYTSESTLLRASVNTASSVIILADPGPEGTSKPDDRTLLATLAIKSISKDPEVCAELLNAESVPHLRRAGLDQTVVSGEFSGFLLANAVFSPGIPQALREIISIRNGSEIRRESMPRDLVGKTYKETVIAFLDRFEKALIGVITEKKTFNLENLLAGEANVIDDFIRRKFDEAGRDLEVESKGRLVVRVNPGKDYIISEDDSAIILTPQGGEG